MGSSFCFGLLLESRSNRAQGFAAPGFFCWVVGFWWTPGGPDTRERIRVAQRREVTRKRSRLCEIHPLSKDLLRLVPPGQLSGPPRRCPAIEFGLFTKPLVAAATQIPAGRYPGHPAAVRSWGSSAADSTPATRHRAGMTTHYLSAIRGGFRGLDPPYIEKRIRARFAGNSLAIGLRDWLGYRYWKRFAARCGNVARQNYPTLFSPIGVIYGTEQGGWRWNSCA